MHINIKYFGQIAEATKLESESIECLGKQVSDVLDILYSKHKELNNKIFKIAQNQELVHINTPLTGAEIALLPPFSGG